MTSDNLAPQLDPEIDPWREAMCRGDFAEAWRISDALLPALRDQDHRATPRHWQTIWDGSSVVGKRVLLRCYHGLGDTIQFIRYASLLQRVAAEVNVWVQPSLIPLLRSAKGIDRLLPLHDGEPEVEYDVDLELNELPYLFRSTLENIPAEVPYLHVEPAVLRPVWRSIQSRVRSRMPSQIRIGLIWQAGDWDASRTIPFPTVLSLASVTGVEWHILQRDAHRAGWDGQFGVLSGGDNPLDDARVMRALDLVISVDTMTAHLAGALGCKTWTLLPFNADWRWLKDRADSPWYPTMRLFRQQREGDWSGLITEVANELTRTTALNHRHFAGARPDP